MTNNKSIMNNFPGNKPSPIAVVFCLGLMVAGCSSSSDPVALTPDPEIPEVDNMEGEVDEVVLTGRFIDSAVSGLSYTTASQMGMTNAEGEYQYLAGEDISFQLGDLMLPTVPADVITTPLSIFSTTSLYDESALNFARLLQTLDTDGNSGNGIVLSSDGLLSVPTDLVFDDPQFDRNVANLIANSGSTNTSLVSGDEALTHLRESLTDNNQSFTACTQSHPSVGKTAAFTTLFHDVSGQLTVVDDCTLEVTGFNYDGEGPLVYFYGANSQAYSSVDAFIIGPLLTGTVFENDRMLLTLPDGKTLDDLDGLSVWCADFAVNFGDAYFGNN